jgi:hypothetical protein
VILAGPIGTGKTHLAIARGVEATKQTRRVFFTRAADLVRQLIEARDARELTRLQQRLLRVDNRDPSKSQGAFRTVQLRRPVRALAGSGRLKSLERVQSP